MTRLRRHFCLLLWMLVAIGDAVAQEAEFHEHRRFKAPEAHQGVAVDESFVYAITNTAVGQYRKRNGELVKRWTAPGGSPLKHLNGGIVDHGKLYAAHSNWPRQPLENTVEVWDVGQLEHVQRIKLPNDRGALTWVDRHEQSWWGVFAKYGEAEIVNQTQLVRFDSEWSPVQSWTFPPEVIARFVPYSCSGGTFGVDGLVYATGHDHGEIYVLKIPTEGKQLELIKTFTAPIEGQGIAVDRHEKGMWYGIRRKSKEVVAFSEALPKRLGGWLKRQQWRRDTPGPVLQLGKPGTFDDTHIFAPLVYAEDGRHRMFYCGSTGAVAERVFHLGLATSDDGIAPFTRVSSDPLYSFGDGKHSVLTPTLLHEGEGNVVREEGKLRMWFSATHFAGGSGLHTLHETTSEDGIRWQPPSQPLLEHVYSPTILKDGDRYRMWYVDVGATGWPVRHATSDDGRSWDVHRDPVMTIDQAWERQRLFYPLVRRVKEDGTYLMWYGSYWADQPNKTALGCAASADGIHWHKHPDNPVLRPDPDRPWESHYNTSQSVIRDEAGNWRMWYASRKAPPFVNKYFAINTAVWSAARRGSDD